VEGVRESQGGGVGRGVGFEEEVAVDFVRAEEEIVAFAEGGDAFEFRAGPDPADWVVRAAEDEESGARGDGAFHGVEIERVAAGACDKKLLEKFKAQRQSAAGPNGSLSRAQRTSYFGGPGAGSTAPAGRGSGPKRTGRTRN
jgi:hypothetical protein